MEAGRDPPRGVVDAYVRMGNKLVVLFYIHDKNGVYLGLNCIWTGTSVGLTAE